jgi:glucose/arabinose dehydrogenase
MFATLATWLLSLFAAAPQCTFIQNGWGPTGTVPLRAEKVVTGLKVPWTVAFLPSGSMLITERAGRLRLVQAGQLQPDPVLTLKIGQTTEGGLLGMALHPQFGSNRIFYLFYTASINGGPVNRVERFYLSPNEKSAVSDGVILDGIQAGPIHDGGRIKFGPDGMLYVATGDAAMPDLSQNNNVLNGKILRVNPDGGVPDDNPMTGSYIFASGVRNLEAFDWIDQNTMIIADNGPTGELGLTGLDKVSYAHASDNLGWPKITGCQTGVDLVTPLLTWKTAAPPGGGVVYHGSAIPDFEGNFLIGMMGTGTNGAHQLHRVAIDPATGALFKHEVYLKDQFGRLRDVEQGPDGALYVTTTNCDGRGTCPSDGDYVIRVTHQ